FPQSRPHGHGSLRGFGGRFASVGGSRSGGDPCHQVRDLWLFQGLTVTAVPAPPGDVNVPVCPRHRVPPVPFPPSVWKSVCVTPGSSSTRRCVPSTPPVPSSRAARRWHVPWP